MGSRGLEQYVDSLYIRSQNVHCIAMLAVTVMNALPVLLS
jgi:hypothetical protein